MYLPHVQYAETNHFHANISVPTGAKLVPKGNTYRHIDSEDYGTGSRQSPDRGLGEGRGGEIRRNRTYSNFYTINIKKPV